MWLVDLKLPESSGHAEMVLEVMFGGHTQDILLEWLGRADIKTNDC